MDWTENKYYVSAILNNLDLDQMPSVVRIAGFDLDDTLVHVPRNSKRQSEYSKWKFIDKSVKTKIKTLMENKYLIVIFTNQAGMSVNKNFDKKGWMNMLDEVSHKLFIQDKNKNYYFAIYAAKNYDLYRKPNLGMWKQMKLDLNEEFNLPKVEISKKSFFVGDAAGRIESSAITKILHPTAKGDHSDTDRKFALNIGIKFIVPEEFYTGTEIDSKYILSGFNPEKFIKKIPVSKFKFKPRSKELIILIGPPGSGKTEFVRKYILDYGYVHINQDVCKTKDRCLSEATEAIKSGQSVIIDNTNPDIASRKPYIDVALKNSYKHIRCIILDTSIELAKHLNNTRHVYSGGLIPKINNIVYHIYKKKYSEPSTKESFDLIEHVNFSFDPTKLDDPIWKRIFMMWSEE